MRLGDQRDVIAGLLYIAFGTAVAIGATYYPLGTSANMGAGYFPLGVGILLVITGLVVLGGALAQQVQTSIGAWPIRNAAIVLAAVVLFALLLEPLGLVITIPVLLSLSALAHPAFSWRAVLISNLVLIPLTCALFVGLLGLQFPLLPSFLTE